MGVVQNIVGMVRDVNDRRQNARIDDALRNYLTDPVASIEGVMDVSPRAGIALNRQRIEDDAATAAAKTAAAKARAERIRGGAALLRGLPEGTNYAEVIAQSGPSFQALGLDESDIGALSNMAQSGINFAAMDDEAWDAMLKDKYTSTVATPGAHVLRGGQVIDRVPFAPRTVTTRGGDGSSRTDVFDPTTMTWNPEPRAAEDYADPGDGGGPVHTDTSALSDDEGGAILEEAFASKVIGRSQAQTIRDSMGAGGGAEFNNWLQRNGIRVVDDGTAARAAPARPASAAPAPSRGGGNAPITMPGKPPAAPERYRTATAEELAGYPEGTAAQVNTATGELVNVKTPPAAVQVGSRLTGRQRENATNKLTLLRQIDAQMARVEAAAEGLDDNGWTGPIGGLVPGNWDAESNVFDKAVNGLTALIRNLTRTPGEGSMSDYESRLAAAIPPSRRDKPEGRDEAMATLRSLVDEARAGYEELLAPPEEAASDGVAVGAIARDRQGNRVRFTGGDSSDPSNWERVR